MIQTPNTKAAKLPIDKQKHNNNNINDRQRYLFIVYFEVFYKSKETYLKQKIKKKKKKKKKKDDSHVCMLFGENSHCTGFYFTTTTKMFGII